MRSWKRKPPFLLALVAGMLLLLPLLAWLQYRWLGQVNQAERERMQANLRKSAADFARDFNGELTRAYLGLQIDKESLLTGNWEHYARRYADYCAQSRHPQLVRDVFLVQPAEGRLPQLARFNPEKGRFDPADWPEDLARLRGQLHLEYRNNEASAQFPRNIKDTFADDIPAIIIPVFNISVSDKDDVMRAVTVSGHTIIRFDFDYLRDRLIPELVRNYFSGDGGLDYQVLVTSRSDPQKIIYRSEPGLSPEMSAAADITADFFDMQVEEFNGLIARRYSSNPSETAPPKRLTVTVLRSSGPPPDVRLPAPMLMLKADSKWVLALKHRAGSLDAAVAVGRRRNLAIGFGILLLLAASMAFIVISTRRAERLARQQMEFVAGVSHELRTPLAVICSAGENLADGLISEREQVKQYGALIQGEGRRLSEMVEQVLEFAGIQSGRRVYKMQSVAAGDLIEGALADARLLIHESGFTVEKEIQSNLPQVMADAPALRRALVNLINNAVKYGGESRWLKIQAQTATGERGPEAQITVEDRGVGIEAGDLPHIFEPFYRGREAVASQIHGSGLGLSLVKHIVESHGGRVMAKSEPGKGSSFTISLPVPSQGSEIRSQEVEVRMSASV